MNTSKMIASTTRGTLLTVVEDLQARRALVSEEAERLRGTSSPRIYIGTALRLAIEAQLLDTLIADYSLVVIRHGQGEQ